MTEEERLKQAFVELCREEFDQRLKCIVLFGSRARDTASEESDWDFFVTAEDLPDSRPERYEKFQPVKSSIYQKFEEFIQVESASPNALFGDWISPLVYGILTGYEVLYGNDFWEKYLDWIRPKIEKGKPELYGKGGKKWEIEKLI